MARSGSRKYIPVTEGEELKEAFKSAATLWYAMLVLVWAYAAAGHMLEGVFSRASFTDESRYLRIAIYVLAGLALPVSAYVRRATMRWAEPDRRVPVVPVETRAARAAGARYRLSVAASLGVSEVTALCGLGLFAVTLDYSRLYALVALSGIAMLWHRPRYRELETLAGKLKQKYRNEGWPPQRGV